MVRNAYKVNPPLVSDQQIINVQPDTEDQTDDEKAICYDRRRRERPQQKRAENEFPSVIRQGPTSPEYVPGAVKEDVTHPSVVWNGEPEVFPA